MLTYSDEKKGQYSSRIRMHMRVSEEMKLYTIEANLDVLGFTVYSSKSKKYLGREANRERSRHVSSQSSIPSFNSYYDAEYYLSEHVDRVCNHGNERITDILIAPHGIYIDKQGGQEWYVKGKLHRDDGPAVTRPDGTKLWYTYGKQLDDAEIAAIQAK